MKFHILYISSVSASFELENTTAYYAQEAYDVTLNGAPAIQGVRTNVFSLFDLKPGTEYCVGVDEYSLSFTTKTETACLNVLDFGALGNGFADDTQAIQNAIYACPPGGRIRVPAGYYCTLLRKLLGAIIIDPQRRGVAPVQIDKNQVSAQFAMLITRTQAFRDYYQNIYGQLKSGLEKIGVPTDGIPQYTKSDFKRIHTSEILNFGMSNFYANLFCDWHWCFIINHTELPFITSDNPLISIYHNIDKYEPISAASPQVTYYLPLSPIVAVEIIHKDILNRDPVLYDVYDSKCIASYNKKIWQECTRFVFSNESIDQMEELLPLCY